MTQYYYYEEGEHGPFTILELSSKGITGETFIWTQGMVTWKLAKDVPELRGILNPDCSPPLFTVNENMQKAEVLENSDVFMDRVYNSQLKEIKPRNKILSRLIYWFGFHCFALIMSYSEIKIFNDYGEPKTENFWPFVKIIGPKYKSIYQRQLRSTGKSYSELRNEKVFNGLFVDYDWTEFSFYVGGAIIIYILYRLSNKR